MKEYLERVTLLQAKTHDPKSHLNGKGILSVKQRGVVERPPEFPFIFSIPSPLSVWSVLVSVLLSLCSVQSLRIWDLNFNPRGVFQEMN